jgi:hypothetical protein
MVQGVRLTYTPGELKEAIRESSSWRQVMQKLGYRTTNGYLAVRLRKEAAELGIDTSKFPSKRVWSRGELAEAIKTSDNWQEVAVKCGLAPHGGNQARLRGIASRFGIEYDHIGRRSDPSIEMPFTAPPSLTLLRDAAHLLAAAWFARRGYAVSLPAQARPYDLIVETPGRLHRVQVKTASRRSARTGQFECNISRIPLRNNQRQAYDPEDVNFFFIVDAEDNYYLIPIAEVGGGMSISLGFFQHRRVDH